MGNNIPEFLVDQITSVDIQGPLVTLHMSRNQNKDGAQEAENTEKLQVTMLVPNFINSVNALNNVAKQMIDKNKAQQDKVQAEDESKK